jgi:hypothetical protein
MRRPRDGSGCLLDDAPYILLCSLLNGPVLLPASGSYLRLVNEPAERWLWLPKSDDAPYILLSSLLNGLVLLLVPGLVSG